MANRNINFHKVSDISAAFGLEHDLAMFNVI